MKDKKLTIYYNKNLDIIIVKKVIFEILFLL